MNIKIHYPDSAEKQSELHNKLSKVHAEAVIEHINNLPLSKEKKIELVYKCIEHASKE